MFKGYNATAFLARFEALLDEYEPDADDERKTELLERNIKWNLQHWIAMMDGFEGND
jgi:hypothetical protein